jgi:hypothetical protein
MLRFVRELPNRDFFSSEREGCDFTGVECAVLPRGIGSETNYSLSPHCVYGIFNAGNRYDADFSWQQRFLRFFGLILSHPEISKSRISLPRIEKSFPWMAKRFQNLNKNQKGC